MTGSNANLGGDYQSRGQYHRHLDKRWKYYPVYVHKMALVRKYLDAAPEHLKTIDLGCGEGLLVEEYRRKGRDIVGLDAHYESAYVQRGDITRLPFAPAAFDTVLALDVIEHLDFPQQELALAEIERVLKPGGRALVTVPNLAHFASRVTFALGGKLLRTASIDRHRGDRPIGEYLDLFQRHGLRVLRRKGLFPTYPLISVLTWLFPGRVVWLHGLYNALVARPGFCFLNLLELRKTSPPLVRRQAA